MKKTLILLIFATLFLGACASTQNYTSAGGGVYYSKPAVSVQSSYRMGWYSYPWSTSYNRFPSNGYGWGYGYGYGWLSLVGEQYGRFSPYWAYPLHYAYRSHLYGPLLHPHYYGQIRHNAKHKSDHGSDHEADHKKRIHKTKKPVRLVTLPTNRYGRAGNAYLVGSARGISSASGNSGHKSKNPPPQRLQPVNGVVIGDSVGVRIIHQGQQPEDSQYSIFNTQGSVGSPRSASSGSFSKTGADPAQRLHGNPKIVSSKPIMLPDSNSDHRQQAPKGSKSKFRSTRTHKFESRSQGSSSSHNKSRPSSRSGHSSSRPSH